MRTRASTLCGAALCCVMVPLMQAGESLPLQAGAMPPVLALGVVRGDGRMVPLATYRQGADGWAAASGYDSSRGDPDTIYITDRAALPTRGWTFHPAGGASSRALAVGGEQTVPAYCGRQEVLVTDVVLPDRSADTARTPLGLATYGPMAVVPVENVVTQPDEASRQVALLVTQMTHLFEADRAVSEQSRLAPVTPEQRARAPVELTRLDRVRGQWEDSYYFESHKTYGYIRPYVRGWVVSSRFRLSLVGVSGGVDAGGESSRPQGRVLGALNSGMWIMETMGYEGSSYELVDLNGFGRLISVSGGGC